ncbi:MAG: MarR family winged helix-turn-helix transcriptional regulator [Vulcanimicrobiaceae bacterium]
MTDAERFDEPGFDLQTSRSFGYLLRDTSRLLLRALQVNIEKHGITLGQYFVLRELWEADGLTLGEIGTRVGTLAPSTNAVVDALEKRGLAVRKRGEQDRRNVHVHLTATGRSLRSELLRYAADVNRRALRGLPPEQVELIRELLQRVKSNLVDDA